MVRIQVTLDTYSGKVNPTWEMPEEKVKEFFEMKGWKDSIFPEDNEANLGLGYRGFVISLLSSNAEKKIPLTSENRGEQESINLPNSFRIYGTKSPSQNVADLRPSLDIQEARTNEKWLLGTARSNVMSFDANTNKIARTDLSQDLIQYVESAISNDTSIEHTPNTQDSPDSFKDMSASPELIAQTYSPQFWNNPSVVRLNNCYNYAANFRTNTFAQPGRGSGCYPFETICSNVVSSAICDGMTTEDMGNSYLIALVIAPSISDYHFYTFHANQGFWGHKPGQSPARNNDDSRRIITGNLTPMNCNRGPYTQFCGYYYIGQNSVIN